MSPSDRQLRRVPITYEALAHLMCDGSKTRVIHGLPQDATILRIVPCDETGILYAFVRSATYPAASRSQLIPEADFPVIEDLNGRPGCH